MIFYALNVYDYHIFIIYQILLTESLSLFSVVTKYL